MTAKTAKLTKTWDIQYITSDEMCSLHLRRIYIPIFKSFSPHLLRIQILVGNPKSVAYQKRSKEVLVSYQNSDIMLICQFL